MHDEIYIHIVGWRDIIRHAKRHRTNSWRPSLVTFETAKLLDLAGTLTPLRLSLYVQLVAMYADAPLMESLEHVEHTGPAPFGARLVHQTAPFARVAQRSCASGAHRRVG